MTRAGAAGSAYGHGGAMAGGDEVSGAAAELARRGKRAWGGGENEVELTGRS